MKVYPDFALQKQAHAGFSQSTPQEAIMLTLTVLSLVLIPVAVDIYFRGRHQTIELSMTRPD